ncbi:hypothetical protein [Noviherbaspirillum massiliense]|uniref:hypothetical protein n=1 Tax=Noviherbaspirillum massiliense TaxID=1465823 RepID=UPI0002FDD431|nr:hypothetical protein [Noviherbaspirillum massiliense]
MLFLDKLDDNQSHDIRKIVGAETFGINEVDPQPDGTIFLEGYFTAREIALIAEMSQRLLRQ